TARGEAAPRRSRPDPVVDRRGAQLRPGEQPAQSRRLRLRHHSLTSAEWWRGAICAPRAVEGRIPCLLRYASTRQRGAMDELTPDIQHSFLDAVHLRKVYAQRKRHTIAVDDLHFSVAEDEFAAVVGPSGC